MIGQAKGLLMARQNVTSDDAFEILRKASQRLNVKLTAVAARVVTSPEQETRTPTLPDGLPPA